VIDAEWVQRLSTWFVGNARSLPWRGTVGQPRDPYGALVSEAMLQQTQVSRVVERFLKFMARFPTVHSLAAAEVGEVLALWSGMGYYRRARSLHAAARMVVERFGGVVPREVASLRELPGVGRYTAGAIASIALGEPAPIVDGNVARVLLRVYGRAVRPDDRATQPWLWERATEIAGAGAQNGPMGAAVGNEALMELGATVCLPLPATPRCGDCPLASVCIARRAGKQMQIPLPKAATVRKPVYCASVVMHGKRGSVLLERRADTGMWAGMWQAPTIEREDRFPTRAELARAVGLRAADLAPRGIFTHATTHRSIECAVFATVGTMPLRPLRGEWVSPASIADRGVSSAQQRVLRLGSGPIATAVSDRPGRRGQGERPVPPAARSTPKPTSPRRARP